MFSKAENAAGKVAFWTALGRYMQPIPGADEMPKKWLNYETGVGGIYLRILLSGSTAYAGIEIADAESERGTQQVEILLQTLPILRRFTGEEWNWISVPNRPVKSLFWGVCLEGKNPAVQSQWPDLISFFKEKLVAMDGYWDEVQVAFE